MKSWSRLLLASLAVCVVIYSVTVLAYVSSSPDIRIRCLMIDRETETSLPEGIVIRATPGLEVKGAKPEPGDLLLKVGRKEVPTFPRLIERIFALRSEPIPPGGLVDAGTDPSELTNLPPLVEDADGKQWVEIEFLRAGSDERLTSSVLVQSIPLGEIVLSFVWFILQLGVTAFGALAYWNRPYDRSARLFFLTCLITMGAYVGGFHWWVLAGKLWLNIPFSICAILVPVVTLHFFLVFPRPKTILTKRPVWVLGSIYVIPLLAIIYSLTVQYLIHRQTIAPATSESIRASLEYLNGFRLGIYGYIAVSGLYFIASLVSLRHSLPHARNPMERGQLRWIWWAGQLAAIFVGYTLYIAITNRQAFALGAGRLPMFVASLSFMFAYSVGILRYRLMVIDQLISKGMVYYLVSCCLTLIFSLAIALGSLLPQILNISLSQQQVFTVMVVFMLGVILLLWTRDVFQQMIDRTFFREKYQLDKALQRMNRAVGNLVDPEALADLMLNSCRDVLDVNRASLYLRMSPDGPFQLLATQGDEESPLQIPADESFLQLMKQGGSFQRVNAGSRDDLSPIQNILRKMKADLAHILEVDTHIVGLVFLGKKNHPAPFTAEDLTFLNALGQITNVALHSAKVDRDLARLNEELQHKTDALEDQKRQIAILQSELTNSQGESLGLSLPLTAEEFQRGNIQGNSPEIQDVLKTVRKVAGSDSTVLLRGESGTGKELLAQTLHENSPRRSGPIIKVHCASLSPNLLESELFGHVKGAFTGADRDRVGRFEMANGGTLFLDEIGDISLETQVKLLRVLQERCFEPVGGTRTVHVDVRLVTATHQNLERLISEGRFREDLYYRLNVITITLPPLRERRDDIITLALHFLNRSANRLGKRIRYFDDGAIAALEQYHWPGNIRELENTIERAVVLAENDRITRKDLPIEISRPGKRLPRHSVHPHPAQRKRLPYENSDPGHTEKPVENELAAADWDVDSGNGTMLSEREILAQALQECDGNKSKAARMLGLPRSTYYSRLKKHGLG
ncbi:MAG: hypothetical protein Tsb009_15370 [Planctomycetaceae bacterium]